MGHIILASLRYIQEEASGRNVGKVFQPCCEAGIREPTLSDEGV